MMIEDIINTYGYGADYLDQHTGYIYHISDWYREYKFFGINLPMNVSENGTIIGTCKINLSLVRI